MKNNFFIPNIKKAVTDVIYAKKLETFLETDSEIDNQPSLLAAQTTDPKLADSEIIQAVKSIRKTKKIFKRSP